MVFEGSTRVSEYCRSPQEAISRMYSICPGLLYCCQYLLHHQVGLPRRCRANVDCFICHLISGFGPVYKYFDHLDKEPSSIRHRVNGHRLDPHLPACPDDPRDDIQQPPPQPPPTCRRSPPCLLSAPCQMLALWGQFDVLCRSSPRTLAGPGYTWYQRLQVQGPYHKGW